VPTCDNDLQGKTLETPERVPFRLTHNIIDGLGVTGVEGTPGLRVYISELTDVHIGVFRISCEVTMQLLRDNKDSLMSVLDAFIHDPLVEWEDEKRKLVGELTVCLSLFTQTQTELRNANRPDEITSNLL